MENEWTDDDQLNDIINMHAYGPELAGENDELSLQVAKLRHELKAARRAALEEAANYIRTHYVGLDDRGRAYEVKTMEVAQTHNSSRETHPVLADAMLKALGDKL
jgi:hypothetical protein